MRFAKGHGTSNDFVIVDEDVELTTELIVALCDRRTGVGGDGVMRVLPVGSALASRQKCGQEDPRAKYFMDYWNSDGSVSEMCGNGVRVFARYLADSGLVDGPVIPIDTRAGLRVCHLEGDQIRVDMGVPLVQGGSTVTVGATAYQGLVVSMGNPHVVCDVSTLEGFDLSVSPGYDEALFPTGVNVEFSLPVGENHRRMRVYERGSGETMSCGTGASAVGVAALHSAGMRTGQVTVGVPGGRLTVTVDDETSWLTGPAVIVFEGDYAGER